MEGMLATGSQLLYCGEQPVQTYQMVRDVITCTQVTTGLEGWPITAQEIDFIIYILRYQIERTLELLIASRGSLHTSQISHLLSTVSFTLATSYSLD